MKHIACVEAVKSFVKVPCCTCISRIIADLMLYRKKVKMRYLKVRIVIIPVFKMSCSEGEVAIQRRCARTDISEKLTRNNAEKLMNY